MLTRHGHFDLRIIQLRLRALASLEIFLPFSPGARSHIGF